MYEFLFLVFQCSPEDAPHLVSVWLIYHQPDYHADVELFISVVAANALMFRPHKSRV